MPTTGTPRKSFRLRPGPLERLQRLARERAWTETQTVEAGLEALDSGPATAGDRPTITMVPIPGRPAHGGRPPRPTWPPSSNSWTAGRGTGTTPTAGSPASSAGPPGGGSRSCSGRERSLRASEAGPARSPARAPGPARDPGRPVAGIRAALVVDECSEAARMNRDLQDARRPELLDRVPDLRADVVRLVHHDDLVELAQVLHRADRGVQLMEYSGRRCSPAARPSTPRPLP